MQFVQDCKQPMSSCAMYRIWAITSRDSCTHTLIRVLLRRTSVCLRNSDEESFASLLGSPRGGLGTRELERHNVEIQNAMSAVDNQLQQLIQTNGGVPGTTNAVRVKWWLINLRYEDRVGITSCLESLWASFHTRTLSLCNHLPLALKLNMPSTFTVSENCNLY